MGPSGRRVWSSLSSTELAFAGVLLTIAAAAWVWTVVGMGAMAAGLWSYPTDLGLYVVSWVVMMTGMMVPSIVPTDRSHQKAVRCHRGGGPPS